MIVISSSSAKNAICEADSVVASSKLAICHCTRCLFYGFKVQITMLPSWLVLWAAVKFGMKEAELFSEILDKFHPIFLK